LRFAYADPPYLGQSRHYKKHHPEAGVWDDPQEHFRLIQRLTDEYPDGWALSASSPSILAFASALPPDTRIASWVKPFAIFKPGVNPAYAWEPVLFRGGRKGDRTRATVRDWHSANITLKKGLAGAKPESVVRWILFGLLGADTEQDTIDDLFPGTGVVGRVWAVESLM
jgi:hypothetical protein